MMGVRAFDNTSSGSSQATGFVVDAERGLILTNRHVVKPGPAVSEACFQNREEIPLRAVYRDPVHDFGFFRYDPKDVKHFQPSAIELRPDEAEVGAAIRVMGNDSGEKLSILSGTLARLDRDAPNYGGGYNDFNTFYLQAGAGTSGGSSGSPVLNEQGHAIGLNAGSKKKAASSYFLPLDRVVPALEAIRARIDREADDAADAPWDIASIVPRGTIEAVFSHETYDEARRLGVDAETERAAREANPASTGMLVVNRLVPSGPSDGKLEEGDVLVRVSGNTCTTFSPLAEALDGAVGGDVELVVVRDGSLVTVTIDVVDLHVITPFKFLSYGGAVLHNLSYQRAILYLVPLTGTYVASGGYLLMNAGIESGSVIVEVGGQPTPTVDDFERVVAAIPDGKRVPVRFFRVGNANRTHIAVIHHTQRWTKTEMWTRNDRTGLWDPRRSETTDDVHVPEAVHTQPLGSDGGNAIVQGIAPSLVVVNATVPFRMEGIHGRAFLGLGVVVDKTRGLVVVDRDTVVSTMGDVVISFASSVELDAQVVFVHQVHNFAILRYDPELINADAVAESELSSGPRLRPGESAWYVGLARSSYRPTSRLATVTEHQKLSLNAAALPRYRAFNVEVICVDQVVSSIGGVLADLDGRVAALYSTFSGADGDKNIAMARGLPVDLILPCLQLVQEGKDPRILDLGIELWPVLSKTARKYGLEKEWIAKLEAHDARHQVLSVRRRQCETDADALLKEGDLILALNGEPVTDFKETEDLTQTRDAHQATIFRDGAVSDVTLRALPLPTCTTRVVLWCGALIHEPHREISFLQKTLPKGVFIARRSDGSPAQYFKMTSKHFIVKVNETPTPTVDAFLDAVRSIADKTFVRVRLVDLKRKPIVVTVRTELLYWPTSVLAYTDGKWHREALDE